MIKRLLLATDGSAPALGAERLAGWLAYELEAVLEALYVRDIRLVRMPEMMDWGAISMPMPIYHEEIEKVLTARAEAVLERVRKETEEAGVKVEPVVRTGVPYEVIVEEARTSDLVVLGRAGEASGHEATGLGSTTERVVRTSPTPVAVAPLEPVRPDRLLLAYDGSDPAARALHVCAELGRGLSLPAVVLTVDDDAVRAEALAAEAAAYLEERGVTASVQTAAGDPDERILEAEESTDLLVMGAFGKGLIRTWLLGSTAELVLRRAVGPVLVVR
ncbi:MAG TPA: universal stress protein [Oceanithermus profundus]|uniref:Universal stress protein n=1 Tax=Oceanithermus profundus TaxID=187137 RepID=A0A7C4VBK5_9DEIN|nr:universal stress protein [Oceanithermus profundus]